MDLSTMNWQRSSYSSAGGQNCVEIARVWRKSSRSLGDKEECVEVAGASRAVLIRDSKDVDGPLHAVTPEAFRVLLGRIKGGALDL